MLQRRLVVRIDIERFTEFKFSIGRAIERQVYLAEPVVVRGVFRTQPQSPAVVIELIGVIFGLLGFVYFRSRLRTAAPRGFGGRADRPARADRGIRSCALRGRN